MIDIVLRFLTDELNGYLAGRGIQPPCKAVVSRVVDEEGHVALPGHSVGAYLFNIAEERALREHPSRRPDVTVGSTLGLDLSVLFVVNGRDYHQALTVLSHVVTFFHDHPLFDSSQSPGLDRRVGRVAVELEALSAESLHHVWSAIGCRQMPSVMTRVRIDSSH